MHRYCLYALAGAYAVALLPGLPPLPWLWAAAGVGFCSLCLWPCRPIAAAVAGSLLMCAVSRAELQSRLPADLMGNDFIFTVEIMDFTQVNVDSQRLLVKPVDAPDLPRRIRLSWFDATGVPQLGEHWELTARLRPPRGFANPGTFDYAGWLFRQHIGATGYVVQGTRAGKLPRLQGIAAVRRNFVTRIESLLPDDDARAVLLAITVGARHGMTRAAWDRYALTGTSHLMAISGLHVGLAAGAAFLIGRFLFAMLWPRGNVRDAALLLAVSAAVAYALVSGFAIPARRALLMALFAAAAVLLRQRLSPFRVLALAGGAVLLSDPLSILSPGFKLSFGAVAVLLWIGGQRRAGGDSGAAGWTARLWRAFSDLTALQLGLLFGLFVLTSALFARVAWLAPLANLMVLPVFSVVTVPAALGGLLLDGPLAPAGDRLLWLAWISLRAVVAILEGLSGLPGVFRPLASPSGLALIVTALTALWIVLPPGWPGRRLAWPALLAAVLYRPDGPPAACVDVHALDVGQGLSAVLRTHTRTLVFDTGPSFRGGNDTAQMVLLPFLRSIGVDSVDAVIVSHGDLDHAGGLKSLLRGVDVRQLIGGEPRRLAGMHALPCYAGTRWQWDGVTFNVRHPDIGDITDGNDGSCVVEVTVGAARVLLTGDIESRGERRLAERGYLKRTELVFVPHHGSSTSSTAAFVAALQPQFAVVAAGYGNRWGFPKEDVINRWQAAGATVANTALQGALHYRVCPGSGVTLQSTHRDRYRRIWHDTP
ncbi:MAG: DNA internalization-related competence protein ComEC/Rec2 [Woeseia sp.]